MWAEILWISIPQQVLDSIYFHVRRDVGWPCFQVIGQNLSDRLCITTPPYHPSSPPVNPNPGVHQDVAEIALPETPAQILRCVSPSSVGLSSPFRRSCFFLHGLSHHFSWGIQRVLLLTCVTFTDSGDSYLFNFDEDPQLLFGTLTAPIEHIPEAKVQESIDNSFALMIADGLSESFGLDAILGVSQFTLILNLPYVQLKYPITQSRKWRSPVC